MGDRHSIKKLKLFRWLLPAIYMGALSILIIGNVMGAGHTPKSLQFLIHVVSGPCYLLALVFPSNVISNVFVSLIICVSFGTITLIGIGWFIDLLLNRFITKN